MKSQTQSTSTSPCPVKSERADFSEDILQYLQEHHGHLVTMMRMITDLTKRVKQKREYRKVRGWLLSDLSTLIRQKKVIRYRKVSMVRRRPRSAQGFLRISERFTPI